MQRLQQLVELLDTAANDSIKLDALKSYFSTTPPGDAAWALFFMEEKKLGTKTGVGVLKELIQSQTGFPSWMLDASNERINDIPETLALLLPWSGRTCDLTLSTLVVQFLQPLSGFSHRARRETIRCAWDSLNTVQRILFNKMITGGFRIGAPIELVHEALAQVAGIPVSVMSRRLAEDKEPSATSFRDLIESHPEKDKAMTPYPLQQSTGLEDRPSSLGDTQLWGTVWALNGERIQITKRMTISSIWSDQNKSLNSYFPELVDAIELLPSGTVLDGVIIAWSEDKPASSSLLQSRLRSKKPSQKLIQSNPIQFVAHDILERQGIDLRSRPFSERRKELERIMKEWSHQCLLHGSKKESDQINPDVFQQEMFEMDIVLNPESEKELQSPPLRLSELMQPTNWLHLEALLKDRREQKASGFLLKRLDSYYVSKDNEDAWRILKPAPYKANLVLISAQRIQGNQLGHFDRFTFAAWHENRLLSVAITDEGLVLTEREKIQAFINANTEKKQGPNHLVKPQIIIEIAFEDIQKSPRSKSGIRLSQARMVTLTNDLSIEDVPNLDHIKTLLQILD
ncbi:MAG: hypothetical protein HOH33_07415 [Verrucomicrobia bacterium]|jgi:DNA ligase 1|nr:hypothetical protein [Verrucomicrobiota bacterium]